MVVFALDHEAKILSPQKLERYLSNHGNQNMKRALWFSAILIVAACLVYSKYAWDATWSEEVLQADGSRIIVKQSRRYRGYIDWDFKIEIPAPTISSSPVVWEGIIFPTGLYVIDKKIILIGMPANGKAQSYYDSIGDMHRFAAEIYTGGKWQKLDINQVPQQAYENNLHICPKVCPNYSQLITVKRKNSEEFFQQPEMERKLYSVNPAAMR